MRPSLTLLTATCLIMYGQLPSDGQGWPLKLEITPSETTVPNRQDFIAEAIIRNVSGEPQVLRTDMCHYTDWNWLTDNPAVHVQGRPEIPCKKNRLVYVTLKPGEAFKKALTILVSLPDSKPLAQGVTFRLGFELPLGYSPSTQSLPYIWSNPVTVRIKSRLL
jgi:hypothetical protein